jgi:septal ring factor EnvC (AmiA/AmiB activator)
MDPVTKDYIDSRDGAVESRISADVREIKVRLEAMDKVNQTNHQASQKTFLSLERRMGNLEHAMIAMKKTVALTGISATLSTVFGVAAFNAALLSNMQSAFESGRLVSASQSEVRRQIRETDVALDKLRAKLDDTGLAVKSLQGQVGELDARLAPRPPRK